MEFSETGARAFLYLVLTGGSIFWTALIFLSGYSPWIYLGTALYFLLVILWLGTTFGWGATREEVVEDLVDGTTVRPSVGTSAGSPRSMTDSDGNFDDGSFEYRRDHAEAAVEPEQD